MAYWHDKLRQEHDDSEGDYYTYISLKNNGRLSDYAMAMLESKTQLEETFSEYNTTNSKQVRLSKEQNRVFNEFRQNLRYTVNMSSALVLKHSSKKEGDYKKVIDRIRDYINRPYGTYDLKYLTTPAQQYYDILCTTGLVPMTISVPGESPMNKWFQA